MENIKKLIIHNCLPEKLDILIYSSGKTGGTTLYATFINNGYSCIYAHNIYSIINYTIKESINYKEEYEIYLENLTIKDIIKYYSSNNEKFYIIDSYRNILEKCISNFFENIIFFINNDSLIKYELSYILKMELSTLKEYFEKIFINNKYYPLENLEEICEILNNNNSFDHNKKYIEHIHENITYIKIRFSDIKDWNIILSNIFNKEISIFNKNLSINKEYNEIYKQFLDEYKISKNIFYDKFINNKYFKYYNSEQEQLEYIKKWEKKLIDKYIF